MKVTVVALMVVLTAASSSDAAPIFRGLGDLPEGDFGSVASAISADGSVVAGTGTVGPVGLGYKGYYKRGFLWTESTGLLGLGGSPGYDSGTRANGVSADGSVVAGSGDGLRGNPSFATMWQKDAGWTHIGGYGNATDVSDDGTAVVGASGSLTSPYQAFRWTISGGITLDERPGGSYANAVSADGSVVVGSAEGAFRWTAGTGMVIIGAGVASGVSPDGSIVVGRTPTPSGGEEAFFWRAETGMIGLGSPPDWLFSRASDVSADGSLVVGRGRIGHGQAEALIWDAVHGVRILRDVLAEDYGLDLTGWTLSEATGISDDGTVIVGNGANPAGNGEAWMAVIPEPATLFLMGCGAIGLLRRRPRA